jgi:hypothetical protein
MKFRIASFPTLIVFTITILAITPLSRAETKFDFQG